MGLYEIVLALALALGSCVFLYRSQSFLNLKAALLVLLTVWLIGFLGASVYHHFVYKLGFPGPPGISVLGGVACVALVFIGFGRFFLRNSYSQTLEALALSAPWGLALGRIGCIFAGCCLSLLPHGHWYEIFTLLCVGIFNEFWKKNYKKYRLAPSPLAIFLGIYGLTRAILELFRLDSNPISFRLSLIVFLGGFLVDWIRIQRHNRAP